MSFKRINYCLFLSHKENYLTCYYVNSTLKSMSCFISAFCLPWSATHGLSCSVTAQSPWWSLNDWSCSDTLQSSWWTADHAPILSNHRDERMIMLRYSPIIVMNDWSCSDTLQSLWWTVDHAPILSNHWDERLIMLRYYQIIVMSGEYRGMISRRLPTMPLYPK